MFTSFYQPWLKEFDLAPLKESKINCISCTMVKPPQNETLRDPGPFSPQLKCCTYSPFLPNFSVGKILSENRVQTGLDPLTRLGASSLVTPLGLLPLSAVTSQAFGVAEQTACGFVNRETVTCDIWPSRPSVCASYHCVSSRGARGLEYWQKVEALGNLIEWTLAHEALWSLGFTQDETDRMAAATDLPEQASEAVETLWFEWKGRERELYLKTLDAALSISSRELRDSLGEAGEALIQEIRGLETRAGNL